VRKAALALLCVCALASCSSSGKSANNTPTTFTSLTPGATVPNSIDIPQTIDPCNLLTVAEASRLAGKAVTRSAGGGKGSVDCIYANGPSVGAEVTVKVDKDAATAHAEFPNWVQPIPGVASGLKVSQIANLGNEAAETRNGKINAGIYVRKGATLVKIGVHPAATEAMLKAAARTALGRL